MEEESLRSNDFGVNVSLFDCSADNHLRAMDTISKLCEEMDSELFDESEIQRLSSSITFLREWKHFNYEPRVIKFVNEMESCTKEKEAVSGIHLPQFSSANVPMNEGAHGSALSLESSKDFVMYVGGSVWALDWCPRVHERAGGCMKCEFIAVAAHPPESYYHKIGAPLAGRGIVQIWCILNGSSNEVEALPQKGNLKSGSQSNEPSEGKSTVSKKPRGRPRKKPIDKSLDVEAMKGKSTEPKRPRGRPRKKPNNDDLDGNNQFVQALAIKDPEISPVRLAIDSASENIEDDSVQENQDKREEGSQEMTCSNNSALKLPIRSGRLKLKVRAETGSNDAVPLLAANEDMGSSILNHQSHHSSEHDSFVSKSPSLCGSLEIVLASCSTPVDITLPRVVLCLAHNGKVAWDVKWRPYNVGDSKCKQRMGYLAVLLGNGSLEVWEVPHPQMIKVIYSTSAKDGTDPRFVKLEPVFRCSQLKCGDMQSIPLTVEWSTLARPDFLLAGCHDGTVALWKFSVNSSLEDTRPLLYFSADTVPIRAVAWAPVDRDVEGANLILTAGHGGLKFWDIRDPFRPLWDIHPAPRFIYSLDWLPDPRCVVISFDDGTMRILSLVKAACDVPVTGKPFTGTKQQGLSVYNCSSFAIWSVQVSRQTGMVAYCTADGTVLHFQLTAKAVEKDPSRNRAPHFLCGSLTEEYSNIIVYTPLPNNPLTLKKPVNDCGETPKSLRSFLTESTQAKSANANKRKGPVSDDQILALCDGDDPCVESGSGELLLAHTSAKRPKSKSSGAKKPEDNTASVCKDEEEANVQGKDIRKGETGNEIKVFPSKMVALHRVRWNMNKGSERWLCWGGAAGIVRCKEIKMPDICKKSSRKRGT